MRKSVIAALCGLLFVLPAGFADAQNRGACLKDAARLCKGVKAGEGRIVRCLWQNRAQLSPECKEQARKDWEKAMEISADCADDARKFCKGILPGHGRITACLMSHEAELAPVCKAHATKAREGVQKGVEALVLGACNHDRNKFCKNVQAGEGRILNCLKGNWDGLKPACKAKIKRVEKKGK